jgi:glycosyltransferase involved in cell wall biosynthesis
MEFDAGVTAITEAMAMGKAVIATRTRGQVDVVEHGVNGLYVPPRDVRALRQAIERLAADPAEAARMGMAGRQLVERRHGLDRYLERFAAIVESDRRGLPDAYGRAASSTSVS